MSPNGDTPLGVMIRGVWAKGAFFPKEGPPPPGLGEVELMPEAVLQALHETGGSLEKQSACEAVEVLGWLFLF